MKALIAMILAFQFVTIPVTIAQDAAGNTVTTEKAEFTEADAKKIGDQFRENPDGKAKGGSWTKQIITMVIGIMGANMILGNGAMFPSVMVFAAGALVYIMSEITGGKAHNDYLKKKTEDLKMVEEKMKAQGGGGEVQREALESALANEKEILKFINKRKKWLGIVSMLFMAATAAAAIEFFIPTILTPLAVIPKAPMGVGASIPMAAAVAAAFSYVSGGGLTGAFGSALMLYLITLIPSQVAATTFTVGRIAFFAASSMIVNSIKSDLGKRAGIAQENISKLENAIAEYDAATKNTAGVGTDLASTDTSGSETTSGTASGVTSGSTNGSSSTLTNGAVNTLTRTPTSTKLCVTKTETSVDMSEKACGSPLRLTLPSVVADVDAQEMMKINQQGLDVANAFNAGDLDGADLAATGFASQAGRLASLKDKLIAKANATLKSQGKSTLDIDGSAKAQLASMSDALQPKDATGAGVISSLGSGNAALGTDLVGVDDKGIKQDIQENKTSDNAVSANSTTANTAPTSAATAIENAISANEAEADILNPQKSMEESLNKFESSESDISSRTDVSLFQQVSNRYILNYPTLVRRKTIDPVPTK